MSGALVDFALGLELDDVPEAALAAAKSAIADSLACIVAGSDQTGSRIVREWVDDMAGKPEAPLFGTGVRAPAALAALANGTAAHALDYDDVAMTMIHPSASLVPALFAIAERRGASGRDLLTAYVLGFEVQTRICRSINPAHYARGWHTMQTAGVLGAAVAAARLQGLDAEQTARALGIAASSAGGIRKNFGTMVKPLHAGHAALHGVEAADLAVRGFTADTDVLFGKNGYLQLFGTEGDATRVEAAFAPGRQLELAESGVALKRFACCGAIHTALDSLGDLRTEAGFAPEDVRRIETRVNALTPDILVHADAKTGLEGKFSMEYSAAVMVLTGRAGLAQYTDTTAADPRLRELMRKVDVVVDDELPVDLAFFATIVTVELNDGTRLTRRTDVQHGYPADPLTAVELADKVEDCLRGALPGDRAKKVLTAVASLERCPDVRQISALLVPPS